MREGAADETATTIALLRCRAWPER